MWRRRVTLHREPLCLLDLRRGLTTGPAASSVNTARRIRRKDQQQTVVGKCRPIYDSAPTVRRYGARVGARNDTWPAQREFMAATRNNGRAPHWRALRWRVDGVQSADISMAICIRAAANQSIFSFITWFHTGDTHGQFVRRLRVCDATVFFLWVFVLRAVSCPLYCSNCTYRYGHKPTNPRFPR